LALGDSVPGARVWRFIPFAGFRGSRLAIPVLLDVGGLLWTA